MEELNRTWVQKPKYLDAYFFSDKMAQLADPDNDEKKVEEFYIARGNRRKTLTNKKDK